jgi:hypothetical protein
MDLHAILSSRVVRDRQPLTSRSARLVRSLLANVSPIIDVSNEWTAPRLVRRPRAITGRTPTLRSGPLVGTPRGVSRCPSSPPRSFGTTATSANRLALFPKARAGYPEPIRPAFVVR